MKTKKKSRYPKRYIPKSLTRKEKKQQKEEINKSRRLYKKGKYHKRKTIKSYKTKESIHIKKAKKIYKIDSIKPSIELSKKTKCSIDGLKEIVSKGMGAYYSSGSRVNQTGDSWGYARLASSITGGKSSVIDKKILERSCNKNGKAYKLLLEGVKKHGTGRRKVAKITI